MWISKIYVSWTSDILRMVLNGQHNMLVDIFCCRGVVSLAKWMCYYYLQTLWSHLFELLLKIEFKTYVKTSVYRTGCGLLRDFMPLFFLFAFSCQSLGNNWMDVPMWKMVPNFYNHCLMMWDNWLVITDWGLFSPHSFVSFPDVACVCNFQCGWIKCRISLRFWLLRHLITII